ncbi:MAG: 2-C-methyl-D-erythritol 4-phosphate cytidylyltransferase [Deltaproteobacteria bacterium]|nr:2-C-methyl-D-erythritol 4-phosphate cytidylyltransferase [Deltaproteobacteria bacterium]
MIRPPFLPENGCLPPKTAAIIPAAGAGVRMTCDRPKQFLTLMGKPLLAVTLQAFEACAEVDGVIVAVPGRK